MNCASFCYLFCCPPCPARIASKLAFSPPCPTYNIIQKQNGTCDFLLTEQAGWVMTESDRLMFEVFYARTARRNSIACLYIRCTQEPKYTILFSHGNAVDLGHTSGFCLNLGLRLNCNILTYDYTGYGINRGIPSEKDIYADIEAACLSSIKRFGIQEETLILYGQSIGTVPTVQLALKYKVAGIILHSPLMSGLRVAFPNTKNTSCCDAFITVDKIDKIMSPTLIIHGTEDDIIDISHSIILYQKCPLAVEPLWVEGAGHNDIELYPAYLERLQQFIVMEINS